jgi:3-methyladenine DNA glycosylase AlkD
MARMQSTPDTLPTATPQQTAADLDRRLAAHGDADKRAWWERYLKGAATFHGVPIATVRQVVMQWYVDHRLAEVDDEEFVAHLSAAVGIPVTENALAAYVLVQDHTLDRVAPERDLPTIAAWFDDGTVADWNSCDWLCVRVLGPLIDRHGAPTARAIARWSDAPGVWRRRAAVVAFVNLVGREQEPFPGCRQLVLDTCASNVADPLRFAQTGVGWVLRELSTAAPDAVATFIDAHRTTMSSEALRTASARLTSTA